jgi:hypothetical protein
MAFFCGFLIADRVIRRVLGCSFIFRKADLSLRPGSVILSKDFRYRLRYRLRCKLKKDLGYHRLSQPSKELQPAATPYFFIYSHSLLEARPDLQPVGNVVEDSSHE